MRATVRFSKPAAGSGSWSIPRSSRSNRSTSDTTARGGISSSTTFRREAPNGCRSSPSGGAARGWHRQVDAGGRDQAEGLQMSHEDALLLMRKFIVPDDLGTPAGAVTLRGATNFRTPAGWDTVYTPVFNADRAACAADAGGPRRDRLVHARNGVPLRAAARRGDIPARTMPIGQVFFVPREGITLPSAPPRNWQRSDRGRGVRPREGGRHRS